MTAMEQSYVTFKAAISLCPHCTLLFKHMIWDSGMSSCLFSDADYLVTATALDNILAVSTTLDPLASDPFSSFAS
jgi:hypothetical protein